MYRNIQIITAVNVETKEFCPGEPPGHRLRGSNIPVLESEYFLGRSSGNLKGSGGNIGTVSGLFGKRGGVSP